MNIKMKKGGGHRIYSPRGLTGNPAPQLISGADPEISERGGAGRKPNSRKGGRGAEFDFLVRLSVIFL